MSSVEVLGALDGYPPLLTIDEAAEVLRIGRSLAYGDGASLRVVRRSRWHAGAPVRLVHPGAALGARRAADHGPRRAPGRWTASLTSPRRGSPVAVTVGPAAADVRRAVGPTAWCALEVLAATPADDGERWVVRSSVRDVAARLGVAPNTAQRALGVLREAGLITAVQAAAARRSVRRDRLPVDRRPDVLGRRRACTRSRRNSP